MQSLAIHTPHGLLSAQFSRPPEAKRCVVVARTQPGPVDSLITAILDGRHYAIVRIDLLSHQEARFPDAALNVPRLSARLLEILEMVALQPDLAELPLGLYATGDATPAAIRAAAQRDAQVKALACHGGIVDRAGLQSLKLLRAPVLMLLDAGAESERTAWLRASGHLAAPHEMHVLGAGESPESRIAAWFATHC